MAVVIDHLSGHQNVLYEDASQLLEGEHALLSRDHECFFQKRVNGYNYQETTINNFFNIEKPVSVLKGIIFNGGLTAIIAYVFFSNLNPLTAFMFSLSHRLLDCCNHKFFGEKTFSIEGQDTNSYEIRTNQTLKIYSKLSIAILVYIVALPIFAANMKIVGIYSALSFVCNCIILSSSSSKQKLVHNNPHLVYK